MFLLPIVETGIVHERTGVAVNDHGAGAALGQTAAETGARAGPGHF
jgi:hypothetical protein